jgi:threonine/homoserine/homoserine lactone efflux protein
MLALVLRGFALGLAIAAPVGPIGVLCIRRTLAQGRGIGFSSGLGAATADVIYGGIAAFGLTALSTALVQQQGWLRLIGGLFLGYLGIKTLLTKPAETAAHAAVRGGHAGAFLSTLLLTLTNPMTIFAFLAIFAGLGVGQSARSYTAASAIVFGVFLGSAAWWLLLSGGVSLLRHKFDARALLWVNRISGLIILLFGLAALRGAT